MRQRLLSGVHLQFLVPWAAAPLGVAYVLAGQTTEGLPPLEQAVEQSTAMRYMQNSLQHKEDGEMRWPSHGPRGRHDWGTYLERGYVAPFRDAMREMPDVDVPVDESGRTMLMEVLAYAGGEPWLEIVILLIGAGADVNRCDVGGRPVWDFGVSA